MKFRSKVDWWLAVIVWLPVAICWVTLLPRIDMMVLIGNLALTAFIALLWFGTFYVIKQDTLVVSLGVTTKKIPVERITSLKASRSLSSSAALSLDRIEINYRETDIFPDIVYVSPKNKALFVAMLVVRNERIELDDSLASLIGKTKEA